MAERPQIPLQDKDTCERGGESSSHLDPTRILSHTQQSSDLQFPGALQGWTGDGDVHCRADPTAPRQREPAASPGWLNNQTPTVSENAAPEGVNDQESTLH